jgi:plastocyanin
VIGATRVLVGGGTVLVAVAAAGLVLAGGAGGDDEDGGPLGPGPVTVALDIEHSAFSVDEITVRAGTEVRFVVTNGDPILHELIVGPPEVHRRHESGTEAAHPPSSRCRRRRPRTCSPTPARSSSPATSPATSPTGCPAPSRSCREGRAFTGDQTVTASRS